MRDLLGKELTVGDRVVVAPKNYRGLIVATVRDLLPKNVRLEYYNTWNYGDEGRLETYVTPYKSVAKV